MKFHVFFSFSSYLFFWIHFLVCHYVNVHSVPTDRQVPVTRYVGTSSLGRKKYTYISWLRKKNNVRLYLSPTMEYLNSFIWPCYGFFFPLFMYLLAVVYIRFVVGLYITGSRAVAFRFRRLPLTFFLFCLQAPTDDRWTKRVFWSNIGTEVKELFLNSMTTQLLWNFLSVLHLIEQLKRTFGVKVTD